MRFMSAGGERCAKLKRKELAGETEGMRMVAGETEGRRPESREEKGFCWERGSANWLNNQSKKLIKKY